MKSYYFFLQGINQENRNEISALLESTNSGKLLLSHYGIDVHLALVTSDSNEESAKQRLCSALNGTNVGIIPADVT
jgi:16S rRNA C1402 (ribose-2'-O) methylase RsmI